MVAVVVRQAPLGHTGLCVSRLGFGTVYLGPAGDNLRPQEGADLLLAALDCGVSFWDTSGDYGSHPHVAAALRRVRRGEVTVASKAREAAGAVERILAELATEYLDILFVHEATLAGARAAREALRQWQPGKAQGKVLALGLSTHSVAVVQMAGTWPEVDLLMLPVNARGICTPEAPIEDGGAEEMLRAAQAAHEAGKGIVGMKVMGCGALAGDAQAAISFAARLPYVDSLCIGMRSPAQVQENVRLLALAEGPAMEL